MAQETEVDPVAEEDTKIEEPITEIEAEVTEKVEIPGAAERTEKILQSISDKLDKAPVKENGPTQEQIQAAWRAQIKKQTNMTDEQIDFMENRMQAVVAPLYADQTYLEWKQEKIAAGIEFDTEVEKGVKDYLSKYDPRVRQDKTLLDNVLYMEIGKRSVSKKPVPVKVATEETKQPVLGRTIVPQTPGPAQSLASGTKKPGAVALTPEEKIVARKMRMTEAEYAQAKETAVISDLKRK